MFNSAKPTKMWGGLDGWNWLWNCWRISCRILKEESCIIIMGLIFKNFELLTLELDLSLKQKSRMLKWS